jgi:hypothetical protein
LIRRSKHVSKHPSTSTIQSYQFKQQQQQQQQEEGRQQEFSAITLCFDPTSLISVDKEQKQAGFVAVHSHVAGYE